MADKQGLNGAYYGPKIPPTQQYHRPGRGSDCGCCCLVTLLLKVIITVLTLIGLFVLIVWLIFRPINKVKFHVTDVALTEFNYTNNTMLRYNLTFNVSIRNPNKKIGIYYNRVEAKAFYEGQRFGYRSLTPFYQGHKNTTVLNVVFTGTQPVTLQGEDLKQFNSEKTSGLYSIALELSLRVKFKLGKVKTARFKPKVECDDLKIRLNGPSVAESNNKCKIKFWWWSWFRDFMFMFDWVFDSFCLGVLFFFTLTMLLYMFILIGRDYIGLLFSLNYVSYVDVYDK